jgi:hypothetical protein
LDSWQCTETGRDSKGDGGVETVIGKFEKINRKTQVVAGRRAPNFRAEI